METEINHGTYHIGLDLAKGADLSKAVVCKIVDGQAVVVEVLDESQLKEITEDRLNAYRPAFTDRLVSLAALATAAMSCFTLSARNLITDMHLPIGRSHRGHPGSKAPWAPLPIRRARRKAERRRRRHSANRFHALDRRRHRQWKHDRRVAAMSF
jgi:hypothetical protein